MSSSIISRYASKDSFLEDLEIRDVIAAACAGKDYHKKRVLMIVPDGTRTCPLGPVFKGVFEEIGAEAFAGREEEGVLLVPKAGETLYHLRKRPAWAREV